MRATMILYPRNVKCDEKGFNWLAGVAHQTMPLWHEHIVFDARHLAFFDANLCAPFGAILHDIEKADNTFDLGRVPGPVLKVWSQNDFGPRFGGGRMNDTYSTTLAYRRFALQENRKVFAAYMQRELLSKDLPEMSHETRTAFAESICEIFDNAGAHSQSENGIFSCGQFFPGRENISFTIADTGVGFRRNIEARTQRTWSDESAIEWATQKGHTTRLENGGYGLAFLKDFFTSNGGRLQIVSGHGFWQIHGQRENKIVLRHPFPGSFVNLEINTREEIPRGEATSH